MKGMFGIEPQITLHTRGLSLFTYSKKKCKGLIQVLGETKTKEAEPEVWHAPVPGRRANVPRFVAPGTATDHAQVTAYSILPSTTILWCTLVVFVVAILYPLPYIPGRVVNPVRIWLERADWCGLLPVPVAAAAITVSHSGFHRVAIPLVIFIRPAARGILPLGLGR